MPLVKRPPRFDHVDAADDMPVSKIKITMTTSKILTMTATRTNEATYPVRTNAAHHLFGWLIAKLTVVMHADDDEDGDDDDDEQYFMMNDDDQDLKTGMPKRSKHPPS